MSNYRKAIILLGHIGSGKTSFFNKICNKREKVQAGGDSVTRDVFMSTTAYGQGVCVSDTPGFGTDKGRLMHAAAIKAGLAEQSLNRIFILVKFDRIALMKKNIREILEVVSRYKDLITIVVTHWDKSENRAKDEKQIKDEVATQFGIGSYILSGFNSSGQEICQKIDGVVNNQSKKVEITYTEFVSHFQLIDEDLYTEDMQDKILKLQEDFAKGCRHTTNFINQQTDKSKEVADLMHAIMLAIKNYAKQTIEQFEKSHGNIQNQMYAFGQDIEQAYLYHTKLKEAILGEMKGVIRVAQNKMKQYPFSIYNQVKQCPNCKEVFIKVSECPDTYCGNRPDQDDENFRPVYSNYDINITPNNITVKKRDVKQLNANQKQIDQGKDGIGCGAKFNWDSLPPLPNELIQQFLDIGYLDYLNREEIDKTTYVHQSEFFKKQAELAEIDARINIKRV